MFCFDFPCSFGIIYDFFVYDISVIFLISFICFLHFSFLVFIFFILCYFHVLFLVSIFDFFLSLIYLLSLIFYLLSLISFWSTLFCRMLFLTCARHVICDRCSSWWHLLDKLSDVLKVTGITLCDTLHDNTIWGCRHCFKVFIRFLL